MELVETYKMGKFKNKIELKKRIDALKKAKKVWKELGDFTNVTLLDWKIKELEDQYQK